MDALREVGGDRDAASLKNKAAFALMGYSIAGNLVVSFLHIINFVKADSYGPIVLLFFAIQVSFLAISIRRYIVVPTTKIQRSFVVIFEVLAKLGFLRQHLVLMIFAVLGFVWPEYLTLGLLDIVSISPVVNDIIFSIAAKKKELTLVGMLFIISCIIYAAFGMAHFRKYMRPKLFLSYDGEDDGLFSYSYGYDDFEVERPLTNIEEEDAGRALRSSLGKSATMSALGYPKCANLLQCTYYIFSEGLGEAGNIKLSLVKPNPGTDDYPFRIIFDFTFCFWVGIVLFNVVTGIMIDEFASIRERADTRARILGTSCFICNMERETYEELGLATGTPTFDEHLEVDHNIWAYLFYIDYIRKKDPTEHNGIESFVRAQLDENALDWIPFKTSFALQLQGKSGKGNTRGSGSVLKTAALDSGLDSTAAILADIKSIWETKQKQ